MNGLGFNYLGTESPERCEAPLREALEIYRKSVGDDVWRTGAAESALGHCLMTMGRLDEAGPLLLEGYATLESGSGPTRAALERLVTYFGLRNHPEKAAEYGSLLSAATY